MRSQVKAMLSSGAALPSPSSSPASPAAADASAAASCGIGVVLRPSKKTPPDPFMKIESVMVDGPACRAGVKCNDRIIR